MGDHAASGSPPWRCTKRLPGREQKPCPCTGFHASWVCTRGHAWDQHETTWSAVVSKAVFAREWVAQGLRPECVEEAEEKRERWASEAASMAAELGAAEASKRVASKAQRLGISMCAEARMNEAVVETVDGSKLPASTSSRKGSVPQQRRILGKDNQQKQQPGRKQYPMLKPPTAASPPAAVLQAGIKVSVHVDNCEPR